jgi:succinate-semialdehyde dehydrogenase
MFALKTRNAIIIAPHPRGKNCAVQLVKEWNEELAKLGAPENLIQVVTEPSTETGGYLMSRADVVVATGGMGMVKAAYSSGKPSYGVGAGNVQCIIDRNVDLAVAAGKMIEGRIFDNGIICSGEQTVIAHEDDYAAVIAEMQKKGALYVDDPAALQRLRSVLWDEKGVFSRYAVGQSVQKIGEMAKLPVTPEHVVIVAKADGAGTGDLLCKEKMCPVMAAFSYKTFEEAVDIAQANLNIEGAGHSAAIHSHNDAHILYAGERLTVSRFLVNQVSSKMVGGSFFNGLAPTTTLGCGTWGNNSVSENVTFKHLMNTTRISYCLTGRKVPTDAELWGKIQ